MEKKVWMSSNFVRFHNFFFKQMLKVSAFYLENKSFISKKIGQESSNRPLGSSTYPRTVSCPITKDNFKEISRKFSKKLTALLPLTQFQQETFLDSRKLFRALWPRTQSDDPKNEVATAKILLNNTYIYNSYS